MSVKIEDLPRGTRVRGKGVFSEDPYEGDFFRINPYDEKEVELESSVNLNTGDKYGRIFLDKGTVCLVDPLSESETTARADILEEAGRLVHSDRNASYGEPTQNFKDTAALWNIQLAHKLSEPLTSTDVALLLIQLKLARIKAAPKRDNWADIIGYAACGFECDVSEGVITE